MKLNKSIIAVLIGIVFGSASAPVASAGTYGDFEYSSDGSEITITGYTGSGGAVVIPSAIDGLPVAIIGEDAFYYDSGLLSVIIPPSVVVIGDSAFGYCYNLMDVTIPENVISIGDYTFYLCSDLTDVTIPGSVSAIGYRAFNSCGSLTNVSVDAANTIYRDVDGVLFSKDQSVLLQYPIGRTGAYNIPVGVTSIGYYAFAQSDGLTEITIPDSVTIIWNWAFSNCSALTNLDMGNGVHALLDKAFWGCRNLPEVIIPDSVNTIEAYTFRGCSGLTNVVIGRSVSSIGSSAFSSCGSLAEIWFRGDVPSTVGYDIFNESYPTVYYYCSALGWGNTFAGRPTVPYGPCPTHTVTFDLGSHGTRIGGGFLIQQVLDGRDALEPEVLADAGWQFDGWDSDFSSVTADITVNAVYSSGSILYVSLAGSHSPPFADWSTAATNLLDAVNSAINGDTVLVNDGHYVLSSEVNVTDGMIIESVNGADSTIIDGNESVRCFNLGSSVCILRGLTITNGYSSWDDGGGVYCADNTPVLESCVLTGNTAAEADGGGIYYGTLKNCVIESNVSSGYFFMDEWSEVWRGGRGGGAYHSILTNCVLRENTVLGGWADVFFGGGGAYDCLLTDCLLIGNSTTAAAAGGGSYYGTLNNCVLVGNTAYNYGGGSYYGILNNCTLMENTASHGGGSYGGTLNNCTLSENTAISSGGGSCHGTLNNCIVFLNDAPTSTNYYNSSLSYCCAAPLPSGVGCIDTAPGFVDAASGDYRLGVGSPCIDAGTNQAWMVNEEDIDGNPRIVNGIVDIGAYEWTAGSSSTLFTVTFDLGSHGTRSGGGELVQLVVDGGASLAPTVAPESSWQFAGWNSAFSYVVSNMTILALYLADADNDVLPDAWEQEYFGDTTNANPAATSANGVNTVLDAYVAGFDPTDPLAGFYAAEDVQGGDIVIEWPCTSNRAYSVYWTTNLVDGFELIQTVDSCGSFTDTVHQTESTGYYKIDVQLP